MKRASAFLLAIALVLSFAACKKSEPQTENTPPADIENIQKTDPAAAAETILASMTTEEKIYQLFFVTPEALSDEGGVTAVSDSMREGLANRPVGGVVLFGDNIQNRDQLTKLISDMQAVSRLPLFVGVDEEGGTVSRLSGIEGMGVTAQPAMREVGDSGDSKRAYDIGKTIGTEIAALGFNTDFAPVADLLIDENNTEIGTRSFGTNPELVSDMVANLVRGLREGGVASAIKHFPGHGSAESDSHSGRARSERTLEEMQSAELLPFKAGINAFTDFVMVSHMVNRDITKTDMECSMSTNVMKRILRQGIGYTNIIITDSLSMGAITGHYSAGAAALTAFEAGADMLLMPENLGMAVEAMRGAVTSGRISEERLNESVSRILRVKLERGII